MYVCVCLYDYAQVDVIPTPPEQLNRFKPNLSGMFVTYPGMPK